MQSLPRTPIRGLHRGLGEHRGDRVGEALEAVDHGDQKVLDAAVLQLVHHPEPELGALVLLEPETEDLLAAVVPDAGRDMHRLVADQAFVADLHPERVEEDQRIDRLQGTGLPGGNLFQDRVGDHADQIG